MSITFAGITSNETFGSATLTGGTPVYKIAIPGRFMRFDLRNVLLEVDRQFAIIIKSEPVNDPVPSVTRRSVVPVIPDTSGPGILTPSTPTPDPEGGIVVVKVK